MSLTRPDPDGAGPRPVASPRAVPAPAAVADCSRSCRSTDAQAEVMLRGRADIAAILDRADDRLLVVVGPCSVHDADAALEYARRLSAAAPSAARRPAASRCACTSRSRARRPAGRA